MALIDPTQGRSIAGVQIPIEFYWVLDKPAPLAGMKYPGSNFPWAKVHAAGFSQVVSLHPGDYDPSPLHILFSEYLQDLYGSGFPAKPQFEKERVTEAVGLILSALRVSEGVVVHCMGGRGRTGTVLGCALRELGYKADIVVQFLDRIHKSRGKPGWPESHWQEELVTNWKFDS